MRLLKKVTRAPNGASTRPAKVVLPEAKPRKGDPSEDPEDPRQLAHTSATFATSIAILKEIGEVTTKVPFIKGAAGVLLRIVEIKDQIDVYRDRWREVIDSVKRAAEVIVDAYKYSNENGRDIPPDLQHILGSLTGSLQEIESTLRQCQKGSGWAQLKRHVTRSEILQKIEACDRLIKSIIQSYNTSLVMSIHTAQDTEPQAMLSLHQPKVDIPARSHIFHGRDEQVDQIVKVILANSHIPARIAIMGQGGIGKTALSLEILHGRLIKQHFKHKIYFVSCEGCTSTMMVWSEMAKTLNIGINHDISLEQKILSYLESTCCLLCLDNFETPWDQNVTAKLSIEAFLAKVASLSSVTLLITMRGAERPAGIEWTRPLLPPLDLFDYNAARRTFEQIANKWDKWAEKLVNAVDGLPLAITLLGHLAQSLDSKLLWQQWERKNIVSLQRQHGHRLTSLDVSIQLSIEGHRIKDDPPSLLLLSVLSLLPNGLPLDKMSKIEKLLPDIDNILQSMISLHQSSLAINIGNRLNTHPLIRYYCQQHHPLSLEYQVVLEQYYIQLVLDNKNGQMISDGVLEEHSNIASILLNSVKHRQPQLKTIQAIGQYSWVMVLELGIFIEELFHSLKLYEKSIPYEYSIKYLIKWGDCLYSMQNPLSAEKKYNEALYLAEKHNNIVGQADALHGKANILWRQNSLELASDQYTNALLLYENAGDKIGQASTLSQLAELLLRTHDVKKAQENAKKALKLYEDVSDIAGQGKGWKCIGNIMMVDGDIDKACQCFYKAIDMYNQANTKSGVADAFHSLGRAYTLQKKYAKAIDYLQEALKLQKNITDCFDQSDTLDCLGDIYFQLDEYDLALECFQSALDIQVKLDYPLLQGISLQGLGKTFAAKSSYSEAIVYIQRALSVHEQCNRLDYIADDLSELGTVYYRQNKLDLAQDNWIQAMNIHRKTNNVHSLAYDIMALGWVYTRKYELETAEHHYLEALTIYDTNNIFYEKAMVLQSLGDLYDYQNRFKEAINYFSSALEIHKKTDSITAQEEILESLKRLYISQDENTNVVDL